jgi:hypothetical protein
MYAVLATRTALLWACDVAGEALRCAAVDARESSAARSGARTKEGYGARGFGGGRSRTSGLCGLRRAARRSGGRAARAHPKRRAAARGSGEERACGPGARAGASGLCGAKRDGGRAAADCDGAMRWATVAARSMCPRRLVKNTGDDETCATDTF